MTPTHITDTDSRRNRMQKPTVRIVPITAGCQRYHATVEELAQVAATGAGAWVSAV